MSCDNNLWNKKLKSSELITKDGLFTILGCFLFRTATKHLLSFSGFFLKLLKRLRVGYFAVTQRFYDFQDLSPCRKGPCICSFIFINRHKKLKLLIRHLTFFSRFSFITSSSAGPALTVQSQTPVNNTLPSVVTAPTLYRMFFIH